MFGSRHTLLRGIGVLKTETLNLYKITISLILQPYSGLSPKTPLKEHFA